ncbi:CehA/McbA family metallohydrolase [Candidatus Hydrogenedentota bacterium]
MLIIKAIMCAAVLTTTGESDLVTVKGVIRDEHGEITAAKINVVDSEGKYIPPAGHPEIVSSARWGGPASRREKLFEFKDENDFIGIEFDKKRDDNKEIREVFYAYVDGKFEFKAAPGTELTIEAVKGIEYYPGTTNYVVPAKDSELDIRLKRWRDMNADGWYSGDDHVHFLPPKTAHIEARAEDLDVINVLVTLWGDWGETSREFFTGKIHEMSTPDCQVFYGEEYRNDSYGHLSVLGLRELLSPISSGNGTAGTTGGVDYPCNTTAAKTMKDSGGHVSCSHFEIAPGREYPMLAHYGVVDSIELLCCTDPNKMWNKTSKLRPLPDPATEKYYHLLNCGFKLPVAAGTDKMMASAAAGSNRVYVNLDGEFTYDTWLKGLTAGRSFVTNGPIIEFSMDGKSVGDVISIKPGEKKTLTITAAAESRYAFDRLELLKDGKVIASDTASDGGLRARINMKVDVSESSWFAARCLGECEPMRSRHFGKPDIPVFAHTSPVYVDVPGKPCVYRKSAEYNVKYIDAAVEAVTKLQHYLNEEQKNEVLGIFARAREFYQALATKATR